MNQKNSVKPIIVTRIPRSYTESARTKASEIISKELDTDYHVIVIIEDVAFIKFECYNADDATSISIAQLQAQVLGNVANNQVEPVKPEQPVKRNYLNIEHG